MINILESVRMALRITTNAFDLELIRLINSAVTDLGIAGVRISDPDDWPIVITAICTYCKMNFGDPENYDRLKKSYDEQKAQLSTSSVFNGGE